MFLVRSDNISLLIILELIVASSYITDSAKSANNKPESPPHTGAAQSYMRDTARGWG